MKYPEKFETDKELLAWYEQHTWHHNRLAGLVSQFLRWKIESFFKKGGHLPVLANVTYREKSMNSLTANVSDHARYPEGFSRERIGDLAGARFVFYFDHDVREFCGNPSDPFRSWFGDYSHNNLKEKSPDAVSRNGSSKDYKSWHMPIRVTKGNAFYRCLSVSDCESLSDLFCEVQFRTILQDAWAEAEHELRYKVERAFNTPGLVDMDTQFTSLASSLRSADATLDHLKETFRVWLQKLEPVKPLLYRPWKPTTPSYSKPVIINSVPYDYELLDPLASEDIKLPPPSVEPKPVLFNVDKAMLPFGLSNYKQATWDLLNREDPQFIARITYDSTVVRVTEWRAETRTLEVQLAAYSDQVVTNHKNALRQPSPGDVQGRKIEKLALDAHGQLLSFDLSPMSNTIGVCCVMRTVDHYWAIGLRSSSVAYDPGTWGCSASGALNWVELGHWENRTFNGWFTKGMIREAEEELGYTAEEGELSYLALAREFGRAGKPQVFFLVQSRNTCNELERTFRTYRRSDSEYQRFRFLTDAEAMDLVSYDEQRVNAICGDATAGEELRLNLALGLRRVGKF